MWLNGRVACWLFSCESVLVDAAVSKSISSRCNKTRQSCLILSWFQRHIGEERGRGEKCVYKTVSVAERRGVGRTASIVLSQKGRLWDGVQSLPQLELVSMEMTLEWCWLPIDCSRGSTHCNTGRLQEAGRGTSWSSLDWLCFTAVACYKNI